VLCFRNSDEGIRISLGSTDRPFTTFRSGAPNSVRLGKKRWLRGKTTGLTESWRSRPPGKGVKKNNSFKIKRARKEQKNP